MSFEGGILNVFLPPFLFRTGHWKCNSELRAALRAGDVWLESSRRYSDPETYLIPKGSLDGSAR